MQKRLITNTDHLGKSDLSVPDIYKHFVEVNKTHPSCVVLQGPFIFSELLVNLNKSKINIKQEWAYYNGNQTVTYFRVDVGDGEVFFKISHTYLDNPENFNLSKKRLKDYGKDFLLCPAVEILYDFDRGLPTFLIELIIKNQLQPLRTDKSRIHLVCQEEGNLYTKVFPLISDKAEFDLDLHYGEGFQKFHEQCLKKIINTQQGIVLFHGPPGVGKTFYIRRLLREISIENKIVLYIPNNMVEYLGTPAFNTFLFSMLDSENFTSEDSLLPPPNILLVIEDAEKILLKRDESPYSADGVSIILNSTDGILNDLLRIQVIATFNCDRDQIDEAMLRKKRLIAIREFNKLDIDSARKLIKHLNIQYEPTDSMTLADIYALEDEDNDTLYPIKKERSHIGFKTGKQK